MSNSAKWPSKRISHGMLFLSHLPLCHLCFSLSSASAAWFSCLFSVPNSIKPMPKATGSSNARISWHSYAFCWELYLCNRKNDEFRLSRIRRFLLTIHQTTSYILVETVCIFDKYFHGSDMFLVFNACHISSIDSCFVRNVLLCQLHLFSDCYKFVNQTIIQLLRGFFYQYLLLGCVNCVIHVILTFSSHKQCFDRSIPL